MAGGSKPEWHKNLTLDSTASPFDAPSPLAQKAFKGVQPVSFTRFNIAGILLTIYGLEELPRRRVDVACLYLLHGRGETQDSLAIPAAAFINAWNAQRKPSQPGLVCVCFDQRNHGSRLIDRKANDSWKAGNENHAPDMFNIFAGTAQDVSMLITHLPSYLPFRPTLNICAGISLGGHATWQCVLKDPRVSAAIVIVGCPDYVRLMTDRAIRSKLPSAVSTSPPGRNFLGSKDFPRSLVEVIEQLDPAGVLLGELDTVTGDDHLHPPSDSEKARLRPIMYEKLAGKKLLVLSGGKDRLVPYKQGEPFLTWLKKALDKETGWFNDHGTSLVDITDPTAGHEFSALMRSEAERWLCDVLSNGRPLQGRESKI